MVDYPTLVDNNIITNENKKRKFEEFLLCNLFWTPLGEWNKSRKKRVRKVIAIAKDRLQILLLKLGKFKRIN